MKYGRTAQKAQVAKQSWCANLIRLSENSKIKKSNKVLLTCTKRHVLHRQKHAQEESMTVKTLDATEHSEPSAPADLQKAQLAVRAHLRKDVGTIVLAMMGLGRYRHNSIADLQHLLIDPLVRNRIAVAYPSDEQGGAPNDIAGFAIWASVSGEVDAKIKEQIRAKSFPIRLKPEDWISGEINWLFDIVAPDQTAASAILRNLRKVIDGKALQMHPIVPKLLDEDTAKQVVEQKVDQ